MSGDSLSCGALRTTTQRLRGNYWKLIFNPENVESVSNLCRINVKLVSNSCPQNSFGHEMASQTAVWAENSSILHSCVRGIRFWHSRGLVPDNFSRKSAKPIFIKNSDFLKKNIDPAETFSCERKPLNLITFGASHATWPMLIGNYWNLFYNMQDKLDHRFSQDFQSF